MKICTWNLNGATNKRVDVWNYFININPDIALLQEVGSIPDFIFSNYSVVQMQATKKDGNPQRFSTAILTKGKIEKNIQLQSRLDWVNKEIKFFKGNLIAACVILETGFKLNVISVYSPAWPIDKKRLIDIDTKGVKLETNPELWLTEILYSALKSENINDESWLVAGDFNSSITFDETFSSGNQEIQDRMLSLGFTECLNSHNGKLVPTFKNPKGGKVIHQMDHTFVSKDMYDNLINCKVENSEIIFDKNLSDHLPIITEFEI